MVMFLHFGQYVHDHFLSEGLPVLEIVNLSGNLAKVDGVVLELAFGSNFKHIAISRVFFLDQS